MHQASKQKFLRIGSGLTALLGVVLLTAGLSFGSFSPFSEKKTLPSKEAEASPSTKTDVIAQIVKLPMYFEKNEGQIDPSVKYLTREYGSTFYFTPREIVMVLQKQFQDTEPKTLTSSVLKIQFVGAQVNPLITGIDEQPSKSNYFIGNQPEKWLTNIPHYAKVSYQDLYSGIDALFYGNARQLEYDILVAPGQDPQHVRLHIEGAKELSIDESGHLHLVLEDQQEVQMQKPFVYQMMGENQIAIEGQFVLLAQNEVGFLLGKYDRNQTLVIDPVLAYSTYLGGGGSEIGMGIAVDSSGSAYVTGYTESLNFPTTTGAYQASLTSSRRNAFITKLNPGGTALSYSTYLGGNGMDQGNGIAVDSSGSAYVTGNTQSSNFPLTADAFQTSLAMNATQNAFITKLNPGGTALSYSTYLGGNGVDQGNGIAVDSGGNTYVTGFTSSSNFPTTTDAFQPSLAANASQNAFITKLIPGENALSYSTYLGGNGTDSGNGIAVDSSGTAYVTGATNSSNFPTTTDAFQKTLLGITDAFITKLIPGEIALSYSTYLGGNGADIGNGITVDSSGSAYVTGATNSLNFPITMNAFQTSLKGGQNAFITKLIPGESALSYSTYLGGGNDLGFGIAVDNSGSAYVTGNTRSSDFPTTTDAFQTSISGFYDAFITKLNSGGTALSYSSYLGGSLLDEGYGIAVDSSGSAYVTGFTNSTNFPTTAGAFQTSRASIFNGNAFISKFEIGTPVITAISSTCGPTSGGTSVILTGQNFTNATAVDFGFNAASFLIINNDTQIIAVSPSGTAGTANITVTAPGGPSEPSAASQFTYVPTPTVASLNPSAGCATGGTTVTITGANFTGVSTVYFGSTAAPFVVNSDTQITATSPLGIGTVDVTVITCGGTSLTSAADGFTYQQTTRTMLTVSPNPTPLGQPVTLTATVTPSTATGIVTFLDGDSVLGTAPLVNGTAVFTLSSLAVGNQALSAAYSGDSAYCPSASSVVVLTVITAFPPTHLKGFQRTNIFATQRDIVNILVWKAPNKGTPIVAYKIYRDRSLTKLIAEISAKERLRFKDHNRKEGKTYTYFIVSVDQFGNVSVPAQVMIKARDES